MTPPAPLSAASPALRFTRVVGLVFAANLLSLLVYSQSGFIASGWPRALFTAAVSLLLVAPFVWQWLVRHEKKRGETELALRKSELKFRRLFEGSADALLVIDLSSNRFIDCNPAAAAMLGYAQRDELLNRHPAELSPRLQPDGQTSAAKAPVMIARAMAQGSHRFEWVHCSARRSDFPVEVLLTPIQLEGQQLLMTTWRDLTARNQAEKAIEAAERKMTDLINTTDGIVWEADAITFDFTFISQKAEQLLGYPVKDWLKPGFWVSHLHPDDRSWALEYCASCTRRLEPHHFDYRFIARDGRTVWLHDIVTVVPENGAPRWLRGICVDITERKQDEARIREQAEVIDKAPVAIIITDLAHRVTYCNEGATRLYGLTAEQLFRHTADELLTPETMRVLAPGRAATLATGSWRGEVPVETRAGHRVTAELIMSLIRDQAGQPTARLSIAVDITEKKQMEEQLLRVQRLETLGLLASGISHDLNNILSPVLMAAPLLRIRATHPSDLRVLDTVEKSAERGSALVRQILSFARGAGGERVLLQARHILQDVGLMITDTFPKAVTVETNIPRDLWPVLSSSTQLHQIVLNLCINARDAMQTTGGTLTLSARNETLADVPDGLPAGSYLVIEVADTGSGMTPEVKARIWDPFFTTKAEGQGTGLGLATVRGIVAQHGGTVTVESAPERGSVFRVYLPAAETGVARSEASNSLAPMESDQHDGLVLVIDDNADVRKLITLSLSQWGYRTLQASDSTQAMEHYLAHSADISLVIFDLDLPGQDGLTLARQLQGLRPDLRVLFITGVDSMKSFHLPPLPAGVPLLMKPFARHSLRKEIERALAAPVFAL